MKLLFDHNLSHRLIAELENLYPGSKHVAEFDMATASDDVIWSYAKEHEMTIVSKDSDFYYRSMLLGYPPKVIWIKLGNCKTIQIASLLQTHHANLLEFERDKSVSFLILE